MKEKYRIRGVILILLRSRLDVEAVEVGGAETEVRLTLRPPPPEPSFLRSVPVMRRSCQVSSGPELLSQSATN